MTTPKPRNAAMMISVTGVSFPKVFNYLKYAGHDNEAGEEDDCHSE